MPRTRLFHHHISFGEYSSRHDLQCSQVILSRESSLAFASHDLTDYEEKRKNERYKDDDSGCLFLSVQRYSDHMPVY